jgi:hypothetical protein
MPSKPKKNNKISAEKVKDNFYPFRNTTNTYNLKLVYDYSETIR